MNMMIKTTRHVSQSTDLGGGDGLASTYKQG